MKERLRIRDRRPATFGALLASAGTIILACSCKRGVEARACGQRHDGHAGFAPGMIAHMQAMRQFSDPAQSVQTAPRVIPPFEIDSDASGALATFQPGLATFTSNSAFVQNLGTNGRTNAPTPSCIFSKGEFL